MASISIDSPVGPLTLSASAEGLTGLSFACTDLSVVSEENWGRPASQEILSEAVRQIGEYFAGGRRQFDLPLDLRGTAFQEAVWRAIGRIGYGEVSSYAAIAAVAGNPKAYRAAGTACGANRIAIVIPCHRVVGTDHGLHGFGGGLDVKRWLLAHEAGYTPARSAQGRRELTATST